MKLSNYALAAMAALSLLSCERDLMMDSEGGSSMLGVEVTEKNAKDIVTKTAKEREPYVFEEDGMMMSLSTSVSGMGIQKSSAATRGSTITEAGSSFNTFTLRIFKDDGSEYVDRSGGKGPVTVSYSDNEWSLGSTTWWPESESEKLKFYASNAGSAGASQSVTETILSSGGIQIAYSDSGAAGKSAEQENDLIYAYARKSKSEGTTRSEDTAVGLEFQHALAGIRFVFGDITDSLTLTDVRLGGVTTDGTCIFKEGDFSWTTGSKSDTLSQTFSTKTAKDSSIDGNSGTSTFFIVPQNIADNATMTVTLKYIAAGSEYDEAIEKTYRKTFKFKDLSSEFSKWEAGKMYTYTLKANMMFAELGGTMGAVCRTLGIDSTAVKTITFSTGENPVTSGTDVKSARSLTSINAVFDSSTGELVLHTAAPKIFLRADSSSEFKGLTSLRSIDNIDSLDTRFVKTMANMFSYCSSLTFLDITNFDTDNVTDMNSMFRMCTGLEALDIDAQKFSTEDVTDMGYMFSGCEELSSLDLSGFNTAKVTDMQYMFAQCYDLMEIDVSGFNTAKVTDMQNMFRDCKSVSTLATSGFNTANVTDMQYMFYDCSKVSSFEVTGFDTSNVTNMKYMFYSCSTPAYIDLSNFNTSKVTDMEAMFEGCSGLKTTYVFGFDTRNVVNMALMFKGCSGLTKLDLQNFNTAKVTDMSNMFSYCSKLTSVNVKSFDTSNVSTMLLMFAGCSSLTSLDLSSFKTYYWVVMQSMLENCSKLSTLTLGTYFTVGNTKTYMCKGMGSSISGGTITCTSAAKTALSASATSLTATKWTWSIIS